MRRALRRLVRIALMVAAGLFLLWLGLFFLLRQPNLGRLESDIAGAGSRIMV